MPSVVEASQSFGVHHGIRVVAPHAESSLRLRASARDPPKFFFACLAPWREIFFSQGRRVLGSGSLNHLVRVIESGYVLT